MRTTPPIRPTRALLATALLATALLATVVLAAPPAQAQRTQGTPTSMDFNENNSHFSLTYTVDTSIDAPTVIYANQEYYYPTGYDLYLKSGNKLVPTTSYALS